MFVTICELPKVHIYVRLHRLFNSSGHLDACFWEWCVPSIRAVKLAISSVKTSTLLYSLLFSIDADRASAFTEHVQRRAGWCRCWGVFMGSVCDQRDSCAWWMGCLHLVAAHVINIHARVWPLSLTRHIFHFWDIQGGLAVMLCTLHLLGCRG